MTAKSAIIKLLTLRCRESSELLSAAEDGDLSRMDRWALRAHLFICGPCRKYRRQIRSLRRIINDAMQRLESGEDLHDRRLSDEARARLQSLIESYQG
ncbi:MAG: zf-HC2 domain-containing protein [Planctomycetes bacterium]|nr:zf-HC2 domain-containing protein [Planctomycetota bacterium]